MELLCNIKDCGYNTGGMCFHDNYLKIINGTCEWILGNPNYRVRPPKPEAEPENEVSETSEN